MDVSERAIDAAINVEALNSRIGIQFHLIVMKFNYESNQAFVQNSTM